MTSELLTKFLPLFHRIADGAAARERSRILPHEPVQWLSDSGFTALRVPTRFGGSDISLRDFYELLIALGEADSNVVQALRAHISFIELHRNTPQGEISDWWLSEAGQGKIFGNAVTEKGRGFDGGFQTRIEEGPNGLAINGTKYYSTGTLFSDYIVVAAAQGEQPFVSAVVDATAPGITLVDDWKGFGQRLTASGTTVFENTPVHASRYFSFGGAQESFVTAQFQLVILAALAGVAQSAANDAASYVRNRRRSFSHGLAALPKDDALVQQVVGRIASRAFAAKHTVLGAVGLLQTALEVAAQEADDSKLLTAALAEAELGAQQALISAADLVLEATTLLFEVGGASAVDSDAALDRHWRNARTLTAHNPIIYKERSVGDNLINGTLPVFDWSVGATSTILAAAGSVREN